MKFCVLFGGATTFLILLAGLAQAQNSASGCAASHYKILALPLRPARVNDRGIIAGTTEDHMAATWTQQEGLHAIDLPPGFSSAETTGINGAGDVVGFATRAGTNRTVAFQYSRGQFSILSEERSKAAATNDSGVTVGVNGERLVWWLGKKMLPLGGCCGGIAHAVNNRGQAVGQFNDKEGHYNAFLWDTVHGLRSIAPPQASMSTALAINHAGHILLQTFTPNEFYLRASGTLVPVHLSNEVASQPLALNDCDVIVGEFGAASDFYRAFIWDRKSGLHDLNQRIDAAEGWILESAVDINNRGEIVGIGDRGNQQDVGFLLVPDEKNVNHRGQGGTQR